MYEYSVPSEYHIAIPRDPANLFDLTVGLLGDLSCRSWGNASETPASDLTTDARFAARFFDSYGQSRLAPQVDHYVALLASASYYLSGLPGSSQVLAQQIELPCPDLGCHGLEHLLLWILRGSFLEPLSTRNGAYGEHIGPISREMVTYFSDGVGKDSLLDHTKKLREAAYRNGTPRELLFSDMISALVIQRIPNSAWFCVPEYSGLSVESWKEVLKKPTFIRELWPSQQSLGKVGVFRGVAAVVQMPTSAGKTKAIEVLLRSAFISRRAVRAVIVAPFKALCNEIRQTLLGAFSGESVSIDELSDVLQADFDIAGSTDVPQVLVTTPEKLVYILRYVPGLSNTIGLLVLDEGHQFDNGLRGVTYELLLTSLRALIPASTQKVLISAVIRNSDAVNAWLNGTNGTVVSGVNLNPTFRTVAFASWRDQLGRLEFVVPDNPSEQEFFVPRVIEEQQLELRGRERNPRSFPEREDGQTIALYLGLRLVRNGSVAIFCGRKDTAASLSDRVLSAYDRGLHIENPLAFSDREEVQRLLRLYERHFGTNASLTRCAALGIFSHHGNTPHGLRLAIEHAMKRGLARFVICTSTLAQGVNLPIRYLVVTSVYQGWERIKVRDFQNLIGRAGRSGMHTEGSIIFADPKVFDKRFSRSDRWRWEQSIDLLNPGKTEPCGSSLLTIFQPFESDDRKFCVEVNPSAFVQTYISGKAQLEAFIDEIVQQHSPLGFTREGMSAQIEWKAGILSAVESFLMAHWDIGEMSLTVAEAGSLAQRTLAYSLANETERGQLVELFSILAENIQQKIGEGTHRKGFGRTLLGLTAILDIQNWVREHIDLLSAQLNQENILKTIWALISQYARSKIMRQCEPQAALLQTALDWIEGRAFFRLHSNLLNAGAKIVTRAQRREIKLEQVIDFCENGLGYDATLLLGAIIEMVSLIQPQDYNLLINELQVLQKRLKYGLPSVQSINIYELGFSDRVISLELTTLLVALQSDKQSIREALVRQREEVRLLLNAYPSYFMEVLDHLL